MWFTVQYVCAKLTGMMLEWLLAGLRQTARIFWLNDVSKTHNIFVINYKNTQHENVLIKSF